MEVVIENWGHVIPVSFRKIVTGSFKNDLMECQRILVGRLRGMHDQTGAGGRDMTPAEAEIWHHLQSATHSLGQCLLEFSKADREDVVIRHDGGPDIRDGAPSDGVLV